MLNRLLIAACIAALPMAALAQDEKKLPPQQQRMANCNKEAGDKNLAGDERKKFMSTCLKGAGAAGERKLTAQQQKMATCNKEAGDKKLAGDERKKFMSACLKG